MEKPILSVCLVTYNHVNYISQALNSILSQKTKYNYEIIVLEDCSTDGTQEILKKYKELYPDKISLYLQPTNTKVKHFIEGLKHCNAKYICVLEGDDYWIDDLKIEKQINFLEANPEFVGCSHNSALIFGDQDQPSEVMIKQKMCDVYSINELTSYSVYCHTSSYIYKNIFNGHLPDYDYCNENNLYGDTFTNMLYAEYGPIKYLDEVMSVYRISGLGRWSSLNQIEQKIRNIKGAILYNKLLNGKYEKNFSYAVAIMWQQLNYLLNQATSDYTQKVNEIEKNQVLQ